MKKAGFFLFIVSILMLGCEEDHTNEIQNLKDGEYLIKLYNNSGDLLLTRKGSAENLGAVDNHWEIRLLDPSFAMPDSDPLKTFASLTLYGESLTSTPRELSLNEDYSAVLHQRWYSLENDWGYKSIDGSVTITSMEKSKIKGSFEINLTVDVNAQQNPLWGKYIVAKGHFSSTCPYEDIGGCP